MRPPETARARGLLGGGPGKRDGEMKDTGPSEVRSPAPLRPPRFARWLIAVVIVVALAIVAGGVWVSIDQLNSVRGNVEEDLLAVGGLKAQQIVEWREERLADAGIIQGSRPFGDLVARWLGSGQPADAAEILAWFQNFTKDSGYSGVRLVDASGRVLLDANGNSGPMTQASMGGLQSALASGEPVLTDLHLGNDGKTVELDVIAPVFDTADAEGRPIGAAVLSANAADFLFPVIEKWPMVRKTAETLLVERDGDQVLYLNDLRFRAGSALNLRLPLTRKSTPAVMAVLGAKGIVHGVDYRGAEVVAAVQSVPESPWFIVAKIDSSEAFAGARLRTWLIAGVFALLLVGFLGGTGLYWERGLKRRYREAHALEVSRTALLARYEHLIQQANDVIFVSDKGGHIVEAN